MIKGDCVDSSIVGTGEVIISLDSLKQVLATRKIRLRIYNHSIIKTETGENKSLSVLKYLLRVSITNT